jgi:magnesium transporter
VRGLLEEIHAEDLADLFGELTPEEAAKLLEQLPAEEAAPIFERLDEHEQEDIAQLMAAESIAQIASEMEPDDRADLFSALPDEVGDQLLETLARVDPEAAEDVREIEKWPETSAGHLMTTSYVHVDPTVTVGEAIDAVRAHAKETNAQVYNVYAVDAEHRLTGITPLKDLLVAPDPAAKLSSIWTDNFFTVHPEMDQEEVARRMAKYDLNAVPVVDGTSNVLLGVCTIDDIVDVLTQEQTEDIQRLGAVEPLDVPYFATTFRSFIRKRVVWLVILFFEEFGTQTALRHYDPIMEAVHGALIYVPLLISAGGNSGSQSSTLIIRGLTIGEIKAKDWWRVLMREAAMGLVLGLIIAAIAFGRVLMYPDQSMAFAATVAVTVTFIIMAGCTVGSMLPIILKKFGFDPATSSTPFITSLVDTFGVIIYAHVAKIIMADVIAKAGAG